jgi:O-antigen/teichoic acid export membrane protein
MEPKFKRNIVWNFVGLAISGGIGVAINTLTGLIYGPQALGVFNQVYAAYILFTQLGAFGVMFSVIHYVPQPAHKRGVVIASALVSVVPIALLSALLFAALAPTIGGFLKSDNVTLGIYAAAPGLFLFAINKVAMGIINALNAMRLYAVLQTTRFIAMLVTFLILQQLQVSFVYLSGMLTAAEAMIAIPALSFCYHHAVLPSWQELTFWVRRHLKFGTRALTSGVLVELNSRVDVLVLGFFVDDRSVGIYSFASMLAEGFLQLLLIVRSNFNPLLSQMFASNRRAELMQLMKRGVKQTYLYAITVGVLAILLFPLGLSVINATAYHASWPIFAVLLTGTMLSSGYVPFNFLLLQAGRPAWHSWMVTISVVTNFVLAALFAKFWGLVGVAFVSGISLFLLTSLLVIFSKRLLSLDLISFSVF